MIKNLLLVLLFTALTVIKCEAVPYRCEIKNITQISPSVLEYEIYLYNLSTDTFRFGYLQAGINFNYAGMANGGTISISYVLNSSWNPLTSSPLPAPQDNLTPNTSIGATTNQIRLTAAIVTNNTSAAILPTSPPGVRVGRFRLTNTVPFSNCVKPNFVWSFVSGSNLTNTSVGGYINGALSVTNQTTQNSFSYANQGPEFFVESNPTLNNAYTIGPPTIVIACGQFTWQNTTYTSSGVYYDTLTTSSSCDSVAVLNLTINFNSVNNSSILACDQYTWPVNGQTYTSSGIYQYVVTLPGGCTHTENLNLVIVNGSNSIANVSACDNYTWAANGQTYVSSGTFTSIGLNSAGCPDTSTLNLTIKNSSTFYDTINNCNPIVWNGQNLTTTGNYTYGTTNSNGCDSSVFLNFNYFPAINDTQTVFNCGAYTVNGNTYNVSGTYQYVTLNSFGCVINHILYLTIAQNSYNSTSLQGCGSIFYNNTLYTSSGFFTTTMPNAAGCDSVITLSVTINQPVTQTQYITVCDSYTAGGTTYYVSGNFTIQDTTIAGCDSTVLLNLTVQKSSSNVTFQTALNSYTWPINSVTYTSSGVYTFVSVNSAGCPKYDTLNLTIVYPNGINEEFTKLHSVQLYPNPTQNTSWLSWQAAGVYPSMIKILDVSGRLIQQIDISSVSGKNEMELDLSNLSSGIYVIELWGDRQKQYQSKLVVSK